MKRLTSRPMMLILLFGAAVIIGVSVYNSSGQTGPDGTRIPTFRPEYVLLPEDVLLESAFSNAERHGLSQITSYTSAWMDLGTLWASRGISRTIADVNLPLFIVSYNGSGEWRGLGTFKGILKISGVTIALDATTGHLVSSESAAMDLGAITGIRAEQVFIQDESLGQDSLLTIPSAAR